LGVIFVLVKVAHGAVRALVVASVRLAVRKLIVKQEAVEGWLLAKPVDHCGTRDSVEHVD
jgi:hypothetical protein